MARRFVRYAPARKDKSRLVRIRVSDMRGADAAWWDARVVPTIAITPRRADRFWLWSVMLPALLLHQLGSGRRCRPLVIWAYTDAGTLVRAAMSFVVERYPHLDVSQPGMAHFLWFLSSAPDSIFARYGVSDPPSLGSIAVDNTMVLSESYGLDGRMGLHAAPAGGPALLKLYGVNCQLIQLPAQAPLPPAVRRQNDGRFFYADNGRAGTLLSIGDAHR